MPEQAILEGFNAKQARVGMTGAVRCAALGTSPVKLGTKYNTDIHRNYGYLAPDGLEVSFDEDKQEYIPWQEVNPIRTDITKAVKSVKFTLWQTSIENLAKFLGVDPEDIEETENGFEFYEESLPEFPHEWLSIDVVDGDKHLRLTLLDAQITGRGSMVFKKDEMFGLELTYSSQPASAEDYKESAAKAVGKTANWQINTAWATGGATTESTDGVKALTITTSALPKAEANGEYSATIAASGGTKPYKFEVTTGTLPTGIELDSATGKLSGTVGESPEAATITVKVTDNSQLTATKQLTIEV